MPKTNNLSIFLMKSLDNDLYEEYIVEGCDKYDLAAGTLFIKTSADNTNPDWVQSFFGDKLVEEARAKLIVKTVSAVYFTKVELEDETRTFALVFGYGRFLLKKQYVEEEFGIETSKHAVDSAQIKSIDTLTYDTAIKIKSVQSVSEIDQHDFYLNQDSDILKGVKGRARIQDVGELIKGRMIGGKTSVNMSAKVDVDNLHNFLTQLYDLYKTESENGVKFASNIIVVRDEQIITQINDSLIQNIQNKSYDNIALDLPDDYVSKDRVIEYVVGNDSNECLRTEVLSQYNTIDDIRTSYIQIKDENQAVFTIANLFDSIYFETEIGNKYYLLASGQYYQISQSYKEQVNQYYNSISFDKFTDVKPWHSKVKDGEEKGEDEDAYNKKYKGENYLVLDKELVYPEGTSKFEICDLLSDKKEIIHVKIHYGTSQPLGQLFNQGLVSARALSDKELRSKISDRINKSLNEYVIEGILKDTSDFKLPENFKASEYKVVFILLCKSNVKVENGRPKIPFFAKCALRESAKAIKSLGYTVLMSAVWETKND